MPPVVDPDTGQIKRRGSITLVRNPSWDPHTDPLRGGYPDMIDITTGVPPSEGTGAVARGNGDLLLGDNPPPTLVRRYRSSGKANRVPAPDPWDYIWWLGFNLAEPPFDDVHVRKAANLAIDKAAIVSQVQRAPHLIHGPETATVATHIAPDSEEDNLLLSYDPYSTPGHRGSVPLARHEVARSGYDRNHDGDATRPRAGTCSRGDGMETCPGRRAPSSRRTCDGSGSTST